MAHRDNLKKKKKNCFKPFKIAEWDFEDPYSLRSLSPMEFVSLRNSANAEDDKESFNGLIKPFLLLFGDDKGERIYADDSEATLNEVAEYIPLVAMKRIVEAGTEFNRDEQKKS